jgi:hypothetical protein
MLAVMRPQVCSTRYRTCGNRCIRDLDSMAPSVLPQLEARLTTDLFVNRNTSQRLEKIVQNIILIGPRAGPELIHSDGRIQDSSVGLAQPDPFG